MLVQPKSDSKILDESLCHVFDTIHQIPLKYTFASNQTQILMIIALQNPLCVIRYNYSNSEKCKLFGWCGVRTPNLYDASPVIHIFRFVNV